ncbi:MAG: pentapeptide repeat-containing protein [Treponema sp.]|nr:pentapeptide repeat-containing protein [Treponema sp.]
MYLFNQCQYPGCRSYAISSISEDGNICESDGFCFKHAANPEKLTDDIKKYIMTHDKIVGLNASSLVFEGMDLSNKKFYGCNFQHATFNTIHSTGMRARMCMFDFSTVSDSSFMNSNIQFSSFAGSKMVHAIFTGSDLIQNNFNGITAYQSSFDDSDLYNSRFIKAVLINTSMINCNLKKTIFYESAREGVSFKLSNTREALVDRKVKRRSGLYSFEIDDAPGEL